MAALQIANGITVGIGSLPHRELDDGVRFALDATTIPTVPSLPMPKKSARDTSSGSMSNVSSYGSDVPDTSSWIPTENRRRGAGVAMSSSTALIIAGVSSFDASP